MKYCILGTFWSEKNFILTERYQNRIKWISLSVIDILHAKEQSWASTVHYHLIVNCQGFFQTFARGGIQGSHANLGEAWQLSQGAGRQLSGGTSMVKCAKHGWRANAHHPF